MYELAKQHGFNPPDTFEGWSKVYWGSKLLDKSLADVPRVFLDDVQDLSYMNSDWFSYQAPKWLKIGFWPLFQWLRVRWEHQMFSYMPEMKVYRKLRKRYQTNAFVPELRAYRKIKDINKRIALFIRSPSKEEIPASATS